MDNRKNSSCVDSRIICVGNRFFQPDAAGPMVYELLARRQLSKTVELIDGGLAGLNLLRFLENVEFVVFVDSISGFRESPGIEVISTFDSLHIVPDYDHNTGIGYLLRIAPQVLSDKIPAISLVGIEGRPDMGLCTQAAQMCLDIIAKFQS
jgi:hydrogenase maturation protease